MEKEIIHITDNLRKAVADIKSAILNSQYRLARSANGELLSLYYGIGQYISDNTRNKAWGTGAINAISSQLQKEMPGLRGFSASALKRMRTFYEQWCDIINRPPAVGDLKECDSPINIKALVIRPLMVGELDLHDFLSLSFTHHSEILAKTSSLEERLFYIKQAAVNSWSKDQLVEEMNADIFHHKGKMPNNFIRTMPNKVNALRAISMFKDNYLLDLINMEELEERDNSYIDERMVEQQIVHNIKKFIMTFGTDFTFVGNQYHLEKLGIEQFPDLLFYNRELQALVCVELKMGDFKPIYLGQLSAYLRILDTEVKKPHETPSIGIVLCKTAHKAFVEFLLDGYNSPMGVATYKTPEDIKRLLPSEEQLTQLLNESESPQE